MSVAELVVELERVGVRLWEDAGAIRFRAPKGVMNTERLQILRDQKAEILAHLRDGAGAITAEPDKWYEPFPLTDVQAAYLIGRRNVYSYGGVGCHGYGELIFPELDPARLEVAWNTLIRRHDMLRAVIDPAGSQRILAEMPPYEIQVRDLRGASSEAVSSAIDKTRAEMDHRTYEPDGWPLFELRVTLTDDAALLHFSVDFLIADFVSIQILLDELHTLYSDPSRTLPPLAINFRDYLLGERRAVTGVRHERDREYWTTRINDLPGPPELPVVMGTRGQGEGPPRFRRWEASLDPAAWAALRRRAGQHGVTPAVAVLAAYVEVIAQWSGQPGFTLNLTLLNRMPLHPQVGSLVGDFTSVNLLAVIQDSATGFRDRARALQDQLWQDLDHRLYSGIDVLREMTRQRGEAALMPIVFTSAIGLTDERDEDVSAPSRGEFGYGISQTPQVWIDCQNIERSGGLATNWDVREGVFPDGLIDDMFAAYEQLLRLLTDDDDAWEEQILVALPAAQSAIRSEVSSTTVALPGGLLHDGVVAQALRAPDRVAVVAGQMRLTYGELLGGAIRVADHLRSQDCGLGSIVSIVMDKGPEQVVAVLGTLLTGAAYLPIDTNQPPVRREAIMANAGSRHVLTQGWLVDRDDADSRQHIVVDVDAPVAAPVDPPRCPAGPDDLAYVIYTSGSTGSPKGVMIDHRGAVNTVADINDRFDTSADDRILGLAHLGFDLSVYDIFGPLAVGGCLVLPDPQRTADPSHWADLISTHQITLWNSVPAQMQMLADYLDVFPEVSLPRLRLALLSGDWIPVSLPDQIRGRLPDLRLISLGGATEASIWSICYPIGEVRDDWRSIPYGRPLANQTCHVLNGHLRACPDWVVGALYIGGVGVARGYLGDDERTAAQFIRHPVTGERLYRTGDFGRFLPDGNIEFLGRRDSQVKIRGHRIELVEIETAALTHPSVGAAAALVDGQAALDRRLVAFVESARTSGGAGGLAQLRSALSEAAATGAAGALAGQDPKQVVELAHRLDQVALLVMADALRRQGLFGSLDAAHSLDEILSPDVVAPKFHGIVRRWCGALDRNGMLVRDPVTGRLSDLRPVEPEEIEHAWASVADALRSVDEAPGLVEYFRVSAQHLPEVMRDELDAVQLLFPQGTLETAEAAFRNNVFSRYGNHLICAALRRLAQRSPSGAPLRILDIGAGHWGASADIIPALADIPVEYLFTEVSDFFLNKARVQFGEYPWVRFGVFDMNEDFRKQGLEPNGFDVIVCANGLHYAGDKAATLGRLREILKPPGWLIFSEMTRENYQILTSLEFLFNDAAEGVDDDENGSPQNFLNHEQWLALLNGVGAETYLCWPEPDDVMSELGVHVFAATVKPDRAHVDPAELIAHLGQRLPDYMLPSYIQVIDGLPLTENGKVDRSTLRSWLPDRFPAARPAGPDESLSDLEARLAEIWAEVLPVKRVGRDDDFFALGGDSLLSAQLVARIVERVPEASASAFDDLLRQMLGGPTVAEFAATLAKLAAENPGRSEEDGEPERPSPVVHYEGDGGDVLRVLLHDGIGTLSSFDALPAALARRGPLVALVVREPERYLAYDQSILMELVADQYARLLLAEGFDRFHVVGGGVTGLLAVEVARQLIEAGAEVTDLTIIDGYPVPSAVTDELLAEYLFSATSGVDPVDLGYPADGAPLPRVTEAATPSVAAVGELGALAHLPAPDRVAALAHSVSEAAPDRYVEEELVARFEIFRHTLAAAYPYKATAYAGNISYLHADGVGVPWQADVEEFWRELGLGEFRVLRMPEGNPFGAEPGSASRLAELIDHGV
jgi:pyochelin synthetase